MSQAATETGAAALWSEVEAFYRHEIVLLQQRKYRDWFSFVLPEIQYAVPTLSSTPEGRNPRSDALAYYDEDYRMLEARVAKLESKHSWVENPPSRVRYFSQLLTVVQDGSDIMATTNILVFQHRWNLEQYYVGERCDTLVRSPDGIRLKKRIVYLDREDLGAHGLSVFF